MYFQCNTNSEQRLPPPNILYILTNLFSGQEETLVVNAPTETVIDMPKLKEEPRDTPCNSKLRWMYNRKEKERTRGQASLFISQVNNKCLITIFETRCLLFFGGQRLLGTLAVRQMVVKFWTAFLPKRSSRD